VSSPSSVGGKRDAVEAIVCQLLIHVFLGELPLANQFTKGGHNVIKGKLVVVDAARLHLVGPSNDEWNANATLIALAFQTSQFPIPAEKLGVGTALLMGSVVAAEDNDGI
jgi:hypothetical protein